MGKAKPPDAGAPPDIGEEIETETPPEEKEPQEKAPRQIPGPVEDFLATHALPDRYTLSLAKRNARSGREDTVQTYHNYFPDVEEIGRDHGPGSYIFYFSYYDRKTQRRKKWEPIEFSLAGAHFEEIHREETERKDEERIKKFQLQSSVRGMGGQSPMQALREAAEMLKTFAPSGQQVDFTPLAEAMRSQGENFRAALEALNRPRQPLPEWLTAVLGSTITAITTKLLDKMTEKKEGEDPMKHLTALTTIAEKLGILRDIGSPKEPDKWDRLIGLAEVLFPPLFDRLAQLPAGERKADPTVKLITSSKEFKDLQNDPEGLKKFLASFYDKFGAARTVIAMETCGLPVPEELRKEAAEEEAEKENADGEAPGSGSAPGEG